MRRSSMYVKAGEMERRCLPTSGLELRVGANDAPKIVGYAAVFDTWTDIGGWFRESIKPGAFAKTLKESDVRALMNHDENYVLGRNRAGTLRLKEDKKGLAVEIDPVDSAWANDLMKSMKRGDVDQMSFGFIVNKAEDNYEEDTRVLVDVTLFDVSVVTFPAYPTTSAEVRSKFQNKGKPLANVTTSGTGWVATDAIVFGDGMVTVTRTETPVVTKWDDLDRIITKLKAGEELNADELRVVTAHIPSLSPPAASHAETVPPPAASHADADIRKGDKWTELFIRAERIAPSQKHL
jgi:hypothetical protein